MHHPTTPNYYLLHVAAPRTHGLRGKSLSPSSADIVVRIRDAIFQSGAAAAGSTLPAAGYMLRPVLFPINMIINIYPWLGSAVVYIIYATPPSSPSCFPAGLPTLSCLRHSYSQTSKLGPAVGRAGQFGVTSTVIR